MSKKDNFITVSELNEQIKVILLENLSDTVRVKGEISNIKISGKNIYLTLKDELSAINVISWGGGETLAGTVQNGDDVIVTGKMNCFQKQGTYQIILAKIEKVGIGNLHEKYENLKKTFEQKGYFSKKRKIPNNIGRIAVLTSSEGAVLQDIFYVLKSNHFSGEVHVKNCFVQGQNCPQSVKEGIEFFNKLHKSKPFDLLLIARGGGSFEDLMGYSSKEVVKAIYESQIITISAIGHETDCMLSDLAADFRAPTPSIAGEVISSAQKKKKELLIKNLERIMNIECIISNKLETIKDKLIQYSKMSDTFNPGKFIDNELEKLERKVMIIENNIISNHDDIFYKIEKLKHRNDQFDTKKMLTRGYNILVNEDNELISSTKTLKNIIGKKQKLKIIFADGELDLSQYIGNVTKKN